MINLQTKASFGGYGSANSPVRGELVQRLQHGHLLRYRLGGPGEQEKGGAIEAVVQGLEGELRRATFGLRDELHDKVEHLVRVLGERACDEGETRHEHKKVWVELRCRNLTFMSK